MDSDAIDGYRAMQNENVFACIEMLKQQYTTIMLMPINRFNSLLKWKAKLEEEKQKAMEEELKNK